MTRRAALAVLVVAAFAPGADAAVATTDPVSEQTDAITVTGVLQRMALDAPGAAETRYSLRTADQTWWLDELADPVPESGSTVEVAGTPADEYTLTVDRLRVLAAPMRSLDGLTAPRSTRVLVLRAFWTARPPRQPSLATTRRRVITDSRAWFREVSHRRYTVSGVVTPWLRISRPSDCLGGSYTAMAEAVAAARRAGYRVDDYGRLVLYLPCTGYYAGLADFPGRAVWLYGNLYTSVVMHEQGHNLGLDHASLRQCRRPGWASVTWSSNCSVSEYGDSIDTMGNQRAGHYSALYQLQVGWLQRHTTVSATRKVTLAPYETTGRGLKAVRLVTRSGATYWLEYRTRTGFDASMPAGTAGVQIRYQNGGKTELLDAAPGSSAGFWDADDAHLPTGSSWTTPERVRITVIRQSTAGATVAIRFRAPAPRAPSAPPAVRANGRLRAVRITWTRPADNGSMIRGYLVRRLDNGAQRRLTTTGGLKTSYVWGGLNPARRYRFSVRAVSEVGTSAAAASPAARPLTDEPSVTITRPANGARVSGIVPVSFVATRANGTRRPIVEAFLSVDQTLVASDSSPPFGPFQWDTRDLTNGVHRVRVAVRDDHGRFGAATHSVTVANPLPTVRITSPRAGATVSGPLQVRYARTPADGEWSWINLYVDGAFQAQTYGDDPMPAVTLSPGRHTLRVEATHRFRTVRSPAITVTVPTPTVTITSPDDGATLSGPFEVDYTLTPAAAEWSWVDLLIDGLWVAGGPPGDPIPYDTTSFGDGTHTLTVRGYAGASWDSEPITVTFVPPP